LPRSDISARGVQRAERIREQLLAMGEGVRGSLRERLIRESLAKTESQAWPIRRAKAFKHILDNTEPVILEGEPIVGSIMGLFPLREPQPVHAGIREEAERHLFDVVESGEGVSCDRELMEHDYNYRGGRVGFEELKSLSEEISEKRGEELGLSYGQIFGELQRYFSEEPQVRHLSQQFFHGRKEPEGPLWNFANHLAVDYGKVLQAGYGGLLEETERYLEGAAGKKREFYEAVVISLRAVMEFISKYADAVAERAEKEADAERADEFRLMGAILKRISSEPARGFREALQLFWMTHICLALAGGMALAAGRFDQYAYPFYKRDVETGRITPDEAVELLSCLWLKFNEPKLGAVQNLTIGGVTPEGTDGTNELSYLCLDAARRARVPYPNVSARVHGDTPERLFAETAKTIRVGLGCPSVFNDGIIIPALCEAGFELEDARDYMVMGCQEIMIASKQPSWDVSYGFNLPGSLNRVLDRLAAEGPAGSFEELVEAYKSELAREIGWVVAFAGKKYERVFETGSDPFGSALLQDCLAEGRDMYQGGAKYPATIGMWALGPATAADSLAAVRKFVFEDKAMELAELVGIMKRDFEKEEALRQYLLKKLPKFGNDDERVDLIAKEVAEFFCREVLRHRGPHGEYFLPLLASYLGHVGAGAQTGATPDGRKAGEPLSDAASPAQGRDVSGPTAALKSITRVDHRLSPGGVAVNIKFSPTALEGERGLGNLGSLLRAYFEMGGQEIQVNVVSGKTLLAAKKDPERYRDLVVRVAGFNEYFVKLDSELQDEIIARTEQ